MTLIHFHFFDKAALKRADFDFGIFCKKNPKIKITALRPAASQAEVLCGEIPKPSAQSITLNLN